MFFFFFNFNYTHERVTVLPPPVYAAECNGGGRSRNFLPHQHGVGAARSKMCEFIGGEHQRGTGSWPSGFKRDESIIWLNFACSVSFLTVVRLPSVLL